VAKKGKGEAAAEAVAEPKIEAKMPEQDGPPAPMTGGLLDTLLVAVAVVTVALVGWTFSLDVNRVFDVPKAVALKLGGASLLLVFLLRGVFAVFGKGAPWTSLRLFAAPVFTLLVVLGISTMISLDPWMSLYGVYERQFGFQGLLACVGLFTAGATALRTRRGAIFAFAVLAIVGGVIGAYALLQSQGMDPYGFFKKPHNKVYSTLGNATFAGNALALIFPMSLNLAIVAIMKALRPERWKERPGHPMVLIVTLVVTAAIVGALMVVPGMMAAQDAGMTNESRETMFKLGIGLALVLTAAVAMVGSYGPDWARLQTPGGRWLADAASAGAIATMSVGILVGLFTTRTRGAWVGTAVALVLGFQLMPLIFRDRPKVMRLIAAVNVAVLLSLVTGVVGFINLKPQHVFSRTILSIPHAFNPEHTVYGQGQGTRRYLWTESPRVLVNHQATLDRVAMDRADWREHVEGEPRGDTVAVGLGTTLKKLLVWPFGIGIETYRYAFMSHKSKKLEALDPMTNHDNPHNNYLYTLASCGILGLAAYLWLLWRLLKTAVMHFLGMPEPLLVLGRHKEIQGGLVKVWRVSRGDAGDFVELECVNGPAVGEALRGRHPDLNLEIEPKRVLVRGFPGDPDSFLSTLTKVYVLAEPDHAHRAIAFGVVTSFFSYAVYSIAGFDSVACSVFLYFFLGAAAVFFAPAGRSAEAPLLKVASDSWRRPIGLLGLVAVVLTLVSAHTIVAILNVYKAERQFVGSDEPGGARRGFEERLEGIERAIKTNPRESFYHQSLGGAYSDAARQYRDAAVRAQQQGQAAQSNAYLAKGKEYYGKAEKSLYAALDHAWAPENVFISLFQLYYSWQDMTEAEASLERALMHSPHLGPVRANLAVLKLERGAYAEAMGDCTWVLDIDPSNVMALRTCGRASQKLGHLEDARRYLEKAKSQAPNDTLLQSFLKELDAAQAPHTATTTG